MIGQTFRVGVVNTEQLRCFFEVNAVSGSAGQRRRANQKKVGNTSVDRGPKRRASSLKQEPLFRVDTFLGSTHLVGHDALMGRPPASRLLSTNQVVGSDVAETGNLSREGQRRHRLPGHREVTRRDRKKRGENNNSTRQ